VRGVSEKGGDPTHPPSSPVAMERGWGGWGPHPPKKTLGCAGVLKQWIGMGGLFGLVAATGASAYYWCFNFSSVERSKEPDRPLIVSACSLCLGVV
jgi:hypothetical protein